MDWMTTRTDDNVLRIDMEHTRNDDWERYFLLTSDRHWDNPHSDHELQLAHLREAKERGAGVIDCGDMLCLMQGKSDRRHMKSNIRPEHQADDYLDEVVRSAAGFFKPYAENMILMAHGNHELSIRNKLETDLTERVCERLRMAGSGVICGGIAGWVTFRFLRRDNHKFGSHTLRLRYSHGTMGNGGPVTKGVISTNRRASWIEGADVVCSGHIHEQWMVTLMRHGINSQGKTYTRPVYHLNVPTYKEEFGKGCDGWHNELERPPKPVGAWWLRFYWCRREQRVKVEPRMAT
jgi:hypothetical protein